MLANRIAFDIRQRVSDALWARVCRVLVPESRYAMVRSGSRVGALIQMLAQVGEAVYLSAEAIDGE